METFNIHETKTHLSRLLARVQAGEGFIIAKAGKPIAHVIPCPVEPRKPRRPGAWKGRGWMAPDFDQTPPEVIASFYESVIFPVEETKEKVEA
jgi:prevent-host-death family protein